MLGQKPLEADGYEVVDGHSDDDKTSKKGSTNTYGKTLERLFPLEDAFKKTPSSSSWSTWMSVIFYAPPYNFRHIGYLGYIISRIFSHVKEFLMIPIFCVNSTETGEKKLT